MKKRILYIDILRILACLAVIFNHTSERGFFLFATREWGSAQFYFDLLFSIGCKFAVPVFLAISGALILEKEIQLNLLWKKKIFKTSMLLIVFSLLSYLSNTLLTGNDGSIKHFVLQIYEDKVNYSYWYLYAYIAFLISAPMLSAMLRNLKNPYILYALLIAFLFRSLIPAMELFFLKASYRVSDNLNVTWMMSDIVLYPAMGYFLHHRLSCRSAKKVLPLLWGIAAAGMWITCVLTYREFYTLWTPYIQIHHEVFACVYAAAVFLTVRVLADPIQISNRTGRILASVGQSTLGVYLLHSIFIDIPPFGDGLWNLVNLLPLSQMINGWIYTFAVFAICTLITMLLRKIPGFKWLLS